MPAKAVNTSRVGKRHAGIDEDRGQRRQRNRRRQDLSHAAHDARLGSEAHRHVGAGGKRGGGERRMVGGQAVDARQEPQRRRGVGRSATDAGSHRQVFLQTELSAFEVGHARA